MPTISFSQTAQTSAGENDTYQIVATLIPPASGPTTAAITIPVTIDGTATNLTDFSLSSNSLVFPAGATSAAINLTILADSVIETNESVTLTLSIPNEQAVAGTNLLLHTFTILDDDTKTVSFVNSSAAVSEASGTMSLRLQLSGPSAYDISVPYSISGTAGVNDFSVTTPSHTHHPGRSNQRRNQLADSERHFKRVERVGHIDFRNTRQRHLGTIAAHTLTILDNDPIPLVQFSAISKSSLKRLPMAV